MRATSGLARAPFGRGHLRWLQDVAHQHPASNRKISSANSLGRKMERAVSAFRRTRNQVGDSVHGGLQNVPDEVGDLRIARSFRVKIDDESRLELGHVLATMGGEPDLERLEQRGRFPRSLEQILNEFLMMVGHRRDHRFFVGKVTIDEPDADSGFGADIMHARLVKSAIGEANHGGIENLRAPIWADL